MSSDIYLNFDRRRKVGGMLSLVFCAALLLDTTGWSQEKGMRISARGTSLKPEISGNLLKANGSTSGAAATVLGGFEGMRQNSFIRPPDPHGAIGASGIVQTVNTRVAYWGRSGNLIWQVSCGNFWNSVGNTGDIDNSDPRAVYDPGTGRFYVMVTENVGGFPATANYLNLAVSKNSNPLTSTSADWHFYRIDITQMIDGQPNYAFFPTIGFDSQALSVVFNSYSQATFFYHPEIVVLRKSDIINGFNAPTGAGSTYITDAPVDFATLEPATVVGTGDPGNVAYFIEVPYFTTTAVRLWALNDPLGARQLSTVSVSLPASNGGFSTYGRGAPQAGTTYTVNGGDQEIVKDSVWYNGALWFCHTAGGSAKSVVYYYKIDVNGFPNGTPTLGEAGPIDEGREPTGEDIWSFQPSIGANPQGDLCMVYCRSSGRRFPEIMAVTRTATDTNFGVPVLVKQSSTYYNGPDSPYGLWGNVASVTPDPADGTFWVTHEFVKSAAIFDWGTWWGQVSAGGGGLQNTNFVEFANAAFRVNENTPGFATIAVLNVGGKPGTVQYATTNDTAISGVDYLGRTNTLTFSLGESNKTFTIPIFDNAIVDGNRSLNLTLFNPTGGANLGTITNAILTIVDDEHVPFVSQAGQFQFSSSIYEVTENETIQAPFSTPVYYTRSVSSRSAKGALITVTRTNGAMGRVLVDYATVNGTAISGVDYTNTTGTLMFTDYQMSTNFVVPVRSDFFPNSDKFFNVVLSNARSAPEEDPAIIIPTIGTLSNATVNIIEINNDSTGFSIERVTYRIEEYGDPELTGNFNNTPFFRTNIAVDVILPGGGGTCKINLFAIRGGRAISVGYPLQAGSDYPNYGDWSFSQPRWTDGTQDIVDVSDFDLFEDPGYTRFNVPDNGEFTLSFGSTERRKRLLIPIINDNQVEFNEDIHVWLSDPDDNHHIGANPEATITVLYDEQPAGALDREWNSDNVARTPERPFNATPGANNTVNTVVVQPWDDKTLLGGNFTAVNTISRFRIARLNTDGSVDFTFNPGTGADGFVDVILVDTNTQQVLIGGGFESFNGAQRKGIARLNSNGSLDLTFNPGNGVDGRIRTMIVQTNDGKIIIAGDFTSYNDVVRNGIARLNPDGSLDTTFDPVLGPDNTIWSVALQNSFLGEQKIIIGGDFTSFNNFSVTRLARLNSDGSLDLTFSPGRGANDAVYSVAVLPDGRLLVGGAFTLMDVYRRNGITRLNSSGQMDFSFDPGDGCNNSVYAILPMNDGKTFIGGNFTSFNGTRRVGLAKLKVNGTLDTSFLDTAYNQFAGLVNTNSIQPKNSVNSLAIQSDGAVMIGGSFHQVGGNPSGDVALRNDYTQFTRADARTRYNIARLLGGYTYGPGDIEFISTPYRTDENSATMAITLERIDGRLGSVSALCTTTNNLATGGDDYTSTNRLMKWNQALDGNGRVTPLAVGDVGYKYFVIPILDDDKMEGDETIDLGFINPTGSLLLGGEYIPLGGALGKAQAPLTIVDNDFDFGVFAFSAPSYTVNENGGKATITIIRTNGSTGQVSVDYFTRSGAPPQAIPGSGNDYTDVRATLNFKSGETSKTISIPINDDILVELDENISIVLTNAADGAKLPGGLQTSSLTNTLTIIDNDFSSGRLNFSASSYINREDSGVATITVTRNGGNSGNLSVDYTISNGSALNGSDYFSTNGTLTWADVDSAPKTFSISLVGPDGLIEGTETVNLALTNVTVAGALGGRTNAVLLIEDADSSGTLSFSQTAYAADENGIAANITVIRNGGVAGSVVASYNTSAGSAIPGNDFSNVSGTLTFTNGQTSATFAIPIADDQTTDGDKTVNLFISTATPGITTNAVLTLIDNESFSSPAGTLDSTFDQNVRTDGFVYALSLQSDGRLLIGGDFSSVNDVPRTRIARLQSTGVLDPTFNAIGGPNDSVRSILLQRDGKVLLGGLFSIVNETNRNGITRLNADGSMDISFNPGAGANHPIFTMALQSDDKILVVGAFNTLNGVNRSRIGRLNTNGTLDVTFNPSLGANAPVYAVAVQTDGKILIGGDFTTFNNITRSYLARLNANGTLDTSFTNSLNGPVRAILIQPDGRIVIGGSFTSINGVARNYLARLNVGGTLDTTFLAAGLSGANNVVYAIAQQVDGKLMVGGDFTTFNGVTRSRLTRLINDGVRDGATDPTINFGTGADNFVQSLVIQPDRKIVFAGGFTTYNDQTRKYVARIHGGSLAGPGSLEFTRPTFTVSESQTNATITVRRIGGTTTNVAANFATSNGTAQAGVNYQSASGILSFPEGETRRTFNVPVIDDYDVNADRTVNLTLSNFTNGSSNGPQPNATLVIVNDECSIGFTTPTYTVSENAASGNATISVTRIGASNSMAFVNFATIPGGSATINADYLVTNGVVTFLPGETVKNFNVRIENDAEIEPSETVNLLLSNAGPSPSVRVNNATNASLQIDDDDFGPGQFSLLVTNFFVNEFESSVMVTVTRSNGSSGIVTVKYQTSSGTATSGVDYTETNNTLSFLEGQTSKDIFITIGNDSIRETDETFNISLFGPEGNALLGSLTNATITILDDDALVVPAGSLLTFESLTPTNNVINPSERVKMLFALRNAGRAHVTNLVATLLSSNGITTTNAPVTYGPLGTNGLPVAREFTFNVATNSTNGQRISAVLDLKDGSFSLGTVAFSYTLGEASATFGSTNVITINDNTTANPYPSSINVSGVAGPITKVTATLKNLSHSYPDDVEVLLVSPTGQKVVLMANAGGNLTLSAPGVTVTFDDSSANSLPDSATITNGTFKPTRFGFVDFPPDAPAAPYASSMSAFNGSLANGIWRLYVRDDLDSDSGVMSGGWSLAITSTDVVTPVVDLIAAASATPAAIAVGQNITYTVTVTNYGPAVATNVFVTGSFSSDVVLQSASANVTATNIDSHTVKCNLTAPMTNGARATITFTVRPGSAGDIVNTIMVGSTATEANPANNTIVLTTPVSSAPLQLSVTRNSNSLTLSWPTSASEAFVESSTDFETWTPVPGSPATVGANYTLTVQFSSGTKSFYRLKSP